MRLSPRVCLWMISGLWGAPAHEHTAPHMQVGFQKDLAGLPCGSTKGVPVAPAGVLASCLVRRSAGLGVAWCLGVCLSLGVRYIRAGEADSCFGGVSGQGQPEWNPRGRNLALKKVGGVSPCRVAGPLGLMHMADFSVRASQPTRGFDLLSPFQISIPRRIAGINSERVSLVDTLS